MLQSTTNRAENAVRPFVIDRKNWLFSASVKGAEASAMLYSVAATACANGFNMEDDFTRLFSQSPGTYFCPVNTYDDYASLDRLAFFR